VVLAVAEVVEDRSAATVGRLAVVGHFVETLCPLAVLPREVPLDQRHDIGCPVFRTQSQQNLLRRLSQPFNQAGALQFGEGELELKWGPVQRSDDARPQRADLAGLIAPGVAEAFEDGKRCADVFGARASLLMNHSRVRRSEALLRTTHRLRPPSRPARPASW